MGMGGQQNMQAMVKKAQKMQEQMARYAICPKDRANRLLAWVR